LSTFSNFAETSFELSPMKWIAHPAKRDLTKTVISAVFVVVFLIVVGAFYGIFWSLFGFIVLLVSLHSYFFPTVYEVNDEEVTIKNIFMTQKRRLSEFRRVYTGKNGVLLSPFRRKTVLNQFRGVFLLLPEHRDEVLEFLKDRIENNEIPQDATGGKN
jgi:MFS superfamily sulfate permease-like transporter